MNLPIGVWLIGFGLDTAALCLQCADLRCSSRCSRHIGAARGQISRTSPNSSIGQNNDISRSKSIPTIDAGNVWTIK